MAQGAQLAGLLLIVARIGGQLLVQALDGLVVGVEVFQFLEQLLLHGRQFGGLHPVFACQGVDRVEAFFQ
ncbi:hypothetical protein D9M68_1004370 [compost metagenome]